jgi:PAS domain S-box-containing protein
MAASFSNLPEDPNRRAEKDMSKCLESIATSVAALSAANPAFLDMIGYAREDLVSGRLRWTELTPAEWSAADDRAVAELKVAATVKPPEKEYFRKDGSRVPVLLGSTTFGDHQDEGVPSCSGLTERKHVEQALRDMQTNLGHVVRITTLGELVGRPPRTMTA